MDLAENGTSTPAENEVGTTPEMPTNPKQMSTRKPDRPATTSSECCSSDDNDGTEDEEHVSCFFQ